MTAEGRTPPDPQELIVVEGDVGEEDLEFPGYLLASVGTRGAIPGHKLEYQLRWTELNLYAVTDGTGRYVLQVVGRSIAYHRAGGPCNRGVEMRVKDIPEAVYHDLEACQQRNCKPEELGDLPVNTRVRVERNRSSADECPNVDGVVAALWKPRSRLISGLDELAKDLLTEAAIKDSAFLRVTRKRRVL